MRAHPDSDAARDLSATDSLAKTLGEHHTESLILRSHREPRNEGRPRCVLNRPIDSPVGVVRSVHTTNCPRPVISGQDVRFQYLSIRTLDPLVVSQGFIVAAKSLIKNGKLVGEVERRTADRGAEITLLLLVID